MSPCAIADQTRPRTEIVVPFHLCLCTGKYSTRKRNARDEWSQHTHRTEELLPSLGPNAAMSSKDVPTIGMQSHSSRRATSNKVTKRQATDWEERERVTLNMCTT